MPRSLRTKSESGDVELFRANQVILQPAAKSTYTSNPDTASGDG